ncbi:hypothetical protein [Nocardioides jiangxiensis]|uniref:Ig-like domain (Group 3) n=1 Tax=Nocardioides jiangxiensis TaxID=3064524 RepID=A0ABT9AWR4_9ACTN|nr:hypothetical protein [Nocardioides sp. WY-20]MDO7866907.1 hypothetical protein [Nocardioides sp. WY-20]
MRRTLAALLMLSPLLVAAPADAASTLSVEIISPADGATVTGNLTVTFRVTASAGTPIYSATATFADQKSSFSLYGADCTAGCIETATFDTTRTPDIWTQSGNVSSWEYEDGVSTFAVRADTTDNSAPARATGTVQLDNKRPTVVVDGASRGGVWPLTADDSLLVRAYPSAHDGGSVQAMYLFTSSAKIPMAAPSVVGGPWTASLDTSAYYEDGRRIAVRAVDDRGIGNIGHVVGYMVDHGPILTAPVLGNPTLDDDLDRVEIPFQYALRNNSGNDLPETRVASVTTTIDGAVSSVEPVGASDEVNHVAAGYSGERVPAGQHTIAYTVTDDRGISSTVSAAVDVTQTLFASWDLPSDAVVMPGSKLSLTSRASTTNSSLVDLTVTVDGITAGGFICSASCPTTAEPVVVLPTGQPGTHTVEVTVSPMAGHDMRLTGTYRVLPRALGTLRTRPPGTYGAQVALSGTTSVDGAPRAGVTATLQRRVVGTTTWRAVATTTSDASGIVRFSPIAGRSAYYRVQTLASDGSWGGSTGPSIRVDSFVALTGHLRATTVRAGDAVVVTGTMLPGSCTTKLRLESYRQHRWVTEAERCATSTGTYRLAFRPAATGKLPLRVVRPAGGGFLQTVRRLPTLIITP